MPTNKLITYLKKIKDDKQNPGTNHLDDAVNLYGDVILHFAVFHQNKEIVQSANSDPPKIDEKYLKIVMVNPYAIGCEFDYFLTFL